VLALLLVAALPALAQAEDSSGVQYETEHFESGAKKPKNGAQPETGSEPSAHASKNPGGHQETMPSEGGSEETKEGSGGAAPGNGNGGGGGGEGNGKPAKEAGSANPAGNEASISAEKPVSTQTGQPASHSSGGGSSPLVPILIAVAVLAAISIGAVIYRQRRQGNGGSGSPVSPNAS
jgi:cobalamin biosynthesis Mg chelatase CobN